MSVSYLFQARKALDTVLQETAFPDAAARVRVERDVSLRPPRQEIWGDLSTNIAILLKSNKDISFEKVAEPFLAAFRGLEGVASVRLAENGYINLSYTEAFWQNSLPQVCEEKIHFGLKGVAGPAVAVVFPDAVNDLASARQQGNAETLERLAALCGREIVKSNDPPRSPAGLPLATAIGKCGERKTRFALLANPPAFAAAFSPILATDKAYNNPVFSIPYAQAQIGKLLRRAEEEGTKEGARVEMSVLNLPIELKLAKVASGWPLAVERTLREADVFYLASFLEELSLLFFRAFDAVHPVSSNYLREPGKGPARLVLLTAVEAMLSGGMELLGVQNVKEFE